MVMKAPTDKVTKPVNQKVEEIKQKHIDEQSKSKWASFKSKMSSINKGLTETLKPAGQKISEVSADVGDKFQKSDNKVVKGIRGIIFFIQILEIS